jgi:hypothetical protein
LVLAVSSSTSGGAEVEVRMESTVSDSMEIFSSDNLSNVPCMSWLSIAQFSQWLRELRPIVLKNVLVAEIQLFFYSSKKLKFNFTYAAISS